MAAPIVFVKIGWMKRYRGSSKTDPLLAENFSYFKKFPPSKGHEQWNFWSRNGEVVGYIPRSAGVDISRLGSARTDEKLTGALVVFVARDPVAKVLKVVGWYKDATILRREKFNRTIEKLRVASAIKARSGDCYVVPVPARGLIIPTAHAERGGFGQSPVWYAAQHPGLIRRVRKFVNSNASTGETEAKTGSKQKFPRQQDTERRLAVEKVAMDLAMAYFENTRDVSLQRKGWDVESRTAAATYLIEVKGLSGSDVCFELTPNEYTMLSKKQAVFRLFVVTNALSKNPIARTYTCKKANVGTWISDRGERLRLQDRVGARATHY